MCCQAEEASASAVAAEEREHCRQIIADAKEGSSLPKGALKSANTCSSHSDASILETLSDCSRLDEVVKRLCFSRCPCVCSSAHG